MHTDIPFEALLYDAKCDDTWTENVIAGTVLGSNKN